MARRWLIAITVVIAIAIVVGLVVFLSLVYDQKSQAVSKSFELTYNSSPRWQVTECMPPNGTEVNVSWSGSGAGENSHFVIWPQSYAQPFWFALSVEDDHMLSQGGSYNFSATNMSGPESSVSVLLQYTVNEALGSGSIVSPPCYA